MHSITHLLHLSQNGSQTAFARLFQRVWPTAVADARRLLPCRHLNQDEEDVAQATMLRFWEFINSRQKLGSASLKNRTDLHRFLRFLLKEKCIRLLRHEYRLKRQASRTVSLSVQEKSLADRTSFDALPIQEILSKAIKETCPSRRPAIVMHLFDGLSIAEVARRVNRSERAIDRYLGEFRARLWEEWKD